MTGAQPQPDASNKPKSEDFSAKTAQSIDDFLKNFGVDLTPEEKQALENPALAGAKMVLDEVKERARKMGDAVTTGTQNILNSAATVGAGACAATASIARKLVRLANDVIGAKHEQQNTLANDLVKLAPIVGTYKNYADGWHAYHEGKEKNDQKLIDRGRVLGLASLLVAGLDVGTLGAGFLARHGYNGLKTIIAGFSFIKLGQLSDKIDLFARTAEILLRSKKVQQLTDGFLDIVKPDESKKS